jgi:hypothetical protein
VFFAHADPSLSRFRSTCARVRSRASVCVRVRVRADRMADRLEVAPLGVVQPERRRLGFACEAVLAPHCHSQSAQGLAA